MSGELNTDNTDATGFSQMAVDTTPSLGRVRGGSYFWGLLITPVIAEAATTRGLARMVRAPGP